MREREDLEELARRARAAEEVDVDELAGQRPRPPAPSSPKFDSSALVGGAGLGVPASYVLVWVLQQYVFKGAMPAEVASPLGSVIAAVIAMLVQRFGARAPGEAR